LRFNYISIKYVQVSTPSKVDISKEAIIRKLQYYSQMAQNIIISKYRRFVTSGLLQIYC